MGSFWGCEGERKEYSAAFWEGRSGVRKKIERRKDRERRGGLFL